MEEEQSKKVTTVEEASKSKDTPTPSKRAPRTMMQLWSSRKLWMTIITCALLWFAYWREMRYFNSLTVLPTDKAAVFVPAFVSVTRDFMLAFATVATAYVGVTGWTEWKHGTTSIVNQATSSVFEKKEQKIETIQHNINEEFKTPELQKRYADR